MLFFVLIVFWYYVFNFIVNVFIVIGVGIGVKVLLFGFEWVNLCYESWCLMWKELVMDLFYVGFSYMLLCIVDGFIGSDVVVEYL